ncbi:hypothetical protein B0H34DRAFT_679602 [Crassisporium funariophilum]|nr:hypothetical protein B0H34DRAFT_679602 [Crassisporium funariophilum]
MLNTVVSSQSRVPAPSTNPTHKMRMNNPDVFDGLPKNTDSFLNSCINIFTAQPSVYRTGKSKIRFALSLFKSGSINWRNSVICDMNDPFYTMPSWSEFKNSHKLHQIVQGDRMAEEFFIAFEDLKHVAGFCDASQISLRPLTNATLPSKTAPVATSPVNPTSNVKKPFVANAKTTCWKCGGNGHIGRECKEESKKTGKLTRQLFEEVAELDSNMDRVCLLLNQVDELEDVEEDRDTPTSEKYVLVEVKQYTHVVPAKPVLRPVSMIEVEDPKSHLQCTLNPSTNNELCTHIDCEPANPVLPCPVFNAKPATPKLSTEETVLSKCRNLYPNRSLVARVLNQWVDHGRKSEVDNSLINSLLFLNQHLAIKILRQLRLPRAQLENYQPERIGKLDNSHSVIVPLSVTPADGATPIRKNALLDCGTSGWGYLHYDFVAEHNLPTQPLAHPRGVYNADGTRNTAGSITHTASLLVTIDNHVKNVGPPPLRRVSAKSWSLADPPSLSTDLGPDVDLVRSIDDFALPADDLASFKDDWAALLLAELSPHVLWPHEFSSDIPKYD